MNAAEMGALADRIADARRKRTTIDFLSSDKLAGLSEDDAYRVQFMVHDRLTASGGDRIAGWKVGVALPAQYQPIGLSTPALAGLYQSGLRESGASFAKGWPIKAGVECEIVVRLGKGCPPGAKEWTPESVKDCVGAVYCGMEVVENRYADVSKIDGKGRLTDDFLQAACVIGPEIKDWRSVDFANLQGRSSHEGKELAAGPGANVMGGAMISLAWLANRLLGLGRQLRAGDIVLTGSVHPPQFLPGPGKAESTFDGYGTTTVTFA